MAASTPSRDRDSRPTFRADLEGLRAVAVALVVLYHAGASAFGGGYVGVDVFFVLSGFLITGLLLRELEASGSISLPAFYARRARRLLPAALLVLLVTLIASALVLPPLEVPAVGKDVAAAALYVSNMRFAFQATDYLQAQGAPSPVLHFWSLGVEEQFYLFWPAIVLAVSYGARRLRLRIAAVVVVVTVASLALGIWLTSANEPWAFYTLPSRAWELGIGAFLAVAAPRLSRLPRAAAIVLGWLGVGLVVAAGVAFSVTTPFPGTAAILPTAGSALVILGGFRTGRFAAGRLLATAPLRFLGRISYSLYLWHWPLLILPAAAVARPLTVPERGIGVVAAVVLAAITQRLVEDPLRRGRVLGTIPRRNLATAAALSLAVATASTGIGAAATSALASTTSGSASSDEAQLQQILGATASVPADARGTGSVATDSGSPSAAASGVAATPSPASPLPELSSSPSPSPSPTLAPTADRPVPSGLRPSLAAAVSDYPQPYGDGCNVGFGGTESPACVYGDIHGKSTVVLFGDSHALSWFPAVNRVAAQRGWRLVNLTKSACGSADVPQWVGVLDRAYTECDRWRAASFGRIAAEHPALVILTNSRALAIVGPGGTLLSGSKALDPWTAGLDRTTARLAAMHTKVAIIGDTPRSGVDPPTCLSQHRDSILECATPYGDAVASDWLKATAAVAAKHGATFVDPTPWVCPSGPCPPVIGNFLVYRDQQHLATPFATALADVLGPLLPTP